MRKIINLLLFLSGLCILVLMVVWAGPSKIWDASKKADLILMTSGTLVFASHLFVRSLRWHVMLKTVRKNATKVYEIKLREFIPVYFLNFMVSNITPGRSGEVLAPLLMKRHVGSSAGMGFSVVLVDRILDTLFIVGASILGFIYYLSVSYDGTFLFERKVWLSQSINVVFYTAIAVLIAMTGMMIMVAIWQKGTLVFLTACTNLFFRKRQKQLLEGLSSFYDGLKTVKKVMPILIVYVILSWLLFAISYFLRVRAVMSASLTDACGLQHSPFWPIMSCWIISMCIGMASFIPSGLGSSQASFAYLISVAGGDFAQATAAAILAKFVALIVIFAFGLGSLFLIRKQSSSSVRTGLQE